MIHKILHTADWHLNRTNHSMILPSGLNSKLVDTLEAIKKIDFIIDDQNIEILIIAGDIFQIPKPSPDYISEVINILWNWENKLSLLICIAGNHDSSPSVRYNAIEPLKSAFKNVSHYHFIYDKDIETIQYKKLNFVCFPHTNELRVKSSESIEKALEITTNSIIQEKTNILIGHFPIDEAVHIQDESQLITSDLSLAKIKHIFDKFDLILLGDIHKQQQIDMNAFYSGSIIQNTFNEEDEKKGVYVFDVDSNDKSYEYISVQTPSRKYKTLHFKDISEKSLYIPKDYKNVILRVKLNVDEVDKMLNYDLQLKEYFNEAFIIVPDFSFVNKQGKIIAEITGSDLIMALSTWITENYKEEKPDNFEFILAESIDILKKRIELEKTEETNDT